MKKTIIALLSSLMLAGAICAVSGASSTRENGMVVIMGDGTSPLPMSPLQLTKRPTQIRSTNNSPQPGLEGPGEPR